MDQVLDAEAGRLRVEKDLNRQRGKSAKTQRQEEDDNDNAVNGQIGLVNVELIQHAGWRRAIGFVEYCRTLWC